MRTLGLDFGERRIGVAVTDPTGVLAQPLATIDRGHRGDEAHLRRISEIVTEYQVSRIVVGLPLHLDGRHGPEAEAARAFGESVQECTGIPVDFLDERWTSIEARRALGEVGGSRRRKQSRVDPVAAAILLRTYIERDTR
jgi:putative Holliday junction resolvase